MAGGRGARGGSYDSGLVYTTRRTELPDPDVDFSDAHKAQRISSYADEDAHDISQQSRRKDRQLLNNITQKLHRVEFDAVKPDPDISKKTGFRRKLHNDKFPLIEKEYREERRKDQLRYPWDYTVDNIYRPATRKYRPTRVKPRNAKNKDDANPEPPPGSYPEYDPMGVYHQQPKRQHKELPDLHQKSKYDDMNLHQKLATVKAKVQAMPKCRDASQDVDLALNCLYTPLPKSTVAGQEFTTVEGYEEFDNYKKSGLEGEVAQKVKQSKQDLADFQRGLIERFGMEKKLEFHEILGRKLKIPPPRPMVLFDYDKEQRRPVKRASSEPPLNFRPAPPPSQPLPISRTYIPEPYIFLGHGSSGSSGVKYVSPDPRNTNFTPSSLLAVRNARRHLDRIERELGVANAPSLDEPVIIHHVSTSPARVVHRPAARGAAVRTISQRVRSSSLPPAPRVAPRATGSRVGARRGSRAANIEVEENFDYCDDDGPY